MKQPRIAVTFVHSTGEVIMGRKKKVQFLNSQNKKYGKKKKKNNKKTKLELILKKKILRTSLTDLNSICFIYKREGF